MKDQRVKTPNGIISNESPLQGPEPSPAETGCFPEPAPEPATEETESFIEEPEPAPAEPDPAPAEPEPAPEEPEPAPAEPDPAPEEPEPAPEEPEPAPAEPEPAPEETGAEGNGEQWNIPQVPANADGWPHASLLPGGTSDTELLQEAPDQGHIAEISCSDLSLYENWGSLSSKERAKRARKLRSRGLPIPSETGFISIVAD
ncbi:hypothetical protein N7478_004411 [Penicillium angulare]|uniref:uncharacterized protein n=1 Tax=Penicillium angulare TaxID=116970 RepID=UPI00253FC48F|nr:uncharacterized protein N7478_004411 [Penicillium angulare]KAJ5279039.1 hypothetical protein N7478_004411 [Penicillium angulare]